MEKMQEEKRIPLIKISKIADILNGYAFRSKNYVANGIRVIRIANVQDGFIVDDAPCFYPLDTEEDIDKYQLFEGDLLISLTGNVGRVGMLPASMLPAALNQRVCCLRINQSVISRKYLFYYLRRHQFIRDCVKASKGVAQLNLSTKWLADYEIPLPDLGGQERIVARIEELFSELDNGVETLRKTKQQLEAYRKAMITNAFQLERETEWKRLDEISDISGGITKGRDLTGQETLRLPYLRVANVQDGYLDLSEMKSIELKASEKEKYLLAEGDVLYTEGGDRDKLGRGTVWHGEIKDCVHQNHVFKARINRDVAIPEYVAYWSMSAPARNYFYTKGKQSVNLASINKSVLSALELPVPSLAKQKRIIQEIEEHLSVCNSIEETIEKALEQADAMRQSILKKSFL